MRTLLMIALLLALAPAPARAHCDALDGPVVTAAREALRTGDFSLIAVWVKEPDEAALLSSFKQTLAVRKLNDQARQLADTYFFETAVRLHRAGEGEPYTGLKPAGQITGALAVAEHALATGRSDPLEDMIVAAVRANLRERFRDVTERRNYRRGDVDAGRAYVAAYTSFVHYVVGLYAAATTVPAHIEDPVRHEH